MSAAAANASETMMALVHDGKGGISLQDRPFPHIEHPQDAIVRVTMSSICTSDLHIMHGSVPRALPDTVLGHEFVGVVEQVGADVRGFDPGDRVAVNVETFCGSCFFCERGYVNNCVEGGWELGCRIDGCQAEYVRVPLANQGLTHIPDTVSDKEALLLGDVLATGVFGAGLAEIKPGDTVAVIGAGPVGQCAMLCARNYGPANIIAIDIDAGAGASVRMGNYRLGLSAALRVYKQSGSQIQYAHSAGEKGVYHLSGLGSHYAGFEGNANSQTRYRGSGYGLTLALVPDAGRGGLHLAAGYEYLHIEKELPGSADLVLQKVVPRSFHAEAAWLRGSGNGLRWGVALKARYDYRRGDEGIVDDNNSSQGSGTLGFLTLFEYSALQGRAEAVFGVEAAGHAWYVCPWGEYRRRTSDYLYPAQNMEFTRAGGGVDFRCVLQRRSLLLRLEAGGGYTAGLDSGLTLPVADLAAPLVRMVQYDYGRLRQDAATFRVGLRADYALRRRMSLFLAADYGGGLYGDNTAAHHARVACGIAF